VIVHNVGIPEWFIDHIHYNFSLKISVKKSWNCLGQEDTMKFWFVLSAFTMFHCVYENCWVSVPIYLYTCDNYKPMNGFLWNLRLGNFMNMNESQPVFFMCYGFWDNWIKVTVCLHFRPCVYNNKQRFSEHARRLPKFIIVNDSSKFFDPKPIFFFNDSTAPWGPRPPNFFSRLHDHTF
jgi:hypothetical protein